MIAGPLCDQFGPRWVFAGLLLVGSIPLGLAPLVSTASGLYVSRFFIGILGGSFVPCMVWSTGFFDKNVVGTANALTGGWGNAGGGITYFIMPAVFDSLVARGYDDGAAWRLTFIVPLIIVITTAVAMLLLCPDTPTGRWSERHLHASENLQSHGVVIDDDDNDPSAAAAGAIVDVPGTVADRVSTNDHSTSDDKEKARAREQEQERTRAEERLRPTDYDQEAAVSKDEMIDTARGEVVAKPTLRESLRVMTSPQTAFHVATYFCSFGAELAINAVLGAYYLKNFPALGQTGAANWAAMFGFLNFATRPLGGMVSDVLYRAAGGGRGVQGGLGGVWARKAAVVACGCAAGAALVGAGRADPRAAAGRPQGELFGLVALAAIFLEAGNGANFALVPHVHPRANGLVSGTAGAGGNLGGVVFAVVFRFMGAGTDYAGGLWIIGAITIVLNLILAWVPPLPRGQIGGH